MDVWPSVGDRQRKIGYSSRPAEDKEHKIKWLFF